jgi:AcrR family transcriptional regulator
MRADAKRNYDALITAARDVFAAEGADASMEAIARKASVGVGTLYRHFPKRIDLVEAVYRTDVDELVETAERVVADLDPGEAVDAFLTAFLRYARTKRTLLTEIREAFDKHPDFRLQSRERIDHAADLVLSHAQRAGVMRDDISGADLMQLIGPMCTNATLTEDQGERLVAVIVDGLRPNRR